MWNFINSIARMFLQYYGRKQQMIPMLERFLPKKVDTVISPFLGSGAFEYHLNATRGSKVMGYDKYGALIEYHNILRQHPEALHKAIKACGADRPVERETYKRCHAQLEDMRLTPLQRAVLVFVLHQNSYGGKGGLPDYIKRETVADITKMPETRIKAFRATEGDGFKVLRQLQGGKRSNTLIFLDPPYLLPRNYYKTAFCHDQLYETLSRIQTPWLLCLNADKEVRRMYKRFHVHTIPKRISLKAIKGQTTWEDRHEIVVTNYAC